jgi:DnaJ-class molecular chaperone
MKNNKDETFYDVLGLDEKCTPEDIKKAYRKLSFMHHPDKNGNSQESTEKFQKISEAFSILSDPNERVKYDANRNNPFINIGGNAGMGGGGIRINPMDVFNMFMGGMGGMGGLGGLGGGGMGAPKIIIRTFGPGGSSQFEEVVSDGMMGGDPFSALFNEINRDMRAHMHPHLHAHPQQQHTQMHNMQTTQEMHKDTHLHTHPHTQIPRTPRTPRFSNANQIPVSKPPLISIDVNISLDDVACGNTIPVEIERWNLNRDDNETYELEKHTEYYSLPFGVESGEVVLLTNCGNEAANHTRGDVKVTFHVAEHAIFKRSGLDIHTEKTITLKEALCGFVFNIEHVNGKKFVFNSSSGNIIRDGLIKTIPKLGIRRGENVGNLSIVFHVAYPEKLTDEQVKKLLEVL